MNLNRLGPYSIEKPLGKGGMGSVFAATDTQTGQVKTYLNPLGQAANAVTDTGAFATCP